MAVLAFESVVPAPQEAVFALHETPALLETLHAGMNFRLVSHAGHIRPGARVTVRYRVGPFPVTMVFEHVLYEPPHKFGERLIQGPFRRLRHTHAFETVPGGTRVSDRLEVELPWWLGGALAVRWVVAAKAKRVFAHRYEILKKLVLEQACSTRGTTDGQ